MTSPPLTSISHERPCPSPQITSTAASFREFFSPSRTPPPVLAPHAAQASPVAELKTSGTLFPLAASFLVNVAPEFSGLLLAFNAGVWRYRIPACAARVVQTRDWMINRIVESASLALLSTIPARKRKRVVPVADSGILEHNAIVAAMKSNVVVCYSDGSASPNPGACGAGASLFGADPDTLYDFGATLGHGTNNFGELYRWGCTEIVKLRRITPSIQQWFSLIAS